MSLFYINQVNRILKKHPVYLTAVRQLRREHVKIVTSSSTHEKNSECEQLTLKGSCRRKHPLLNNAVLCSNCCASTSISKVLNSNELASSVVPQDKVLCRGTFNARYLLGNLNLLKSDFSAMGYRHNASVNYLTSNRVHIDQNENNKRPAEASPQVETKNEPVEIGGETQRKETIYTVPNLLTAGRVVLTPFIGALVLEEYYAASLSLFMFAGFTDWLDGWIARRYPNQRSAFGSFMDPLADKILVSVLFVSLTLVEIIPLPLAILVVTRDIGLILSGMYVRFLSIPKPLTMKKYFDMTYASAQLQPLFISKVNTAVQLGLIASSLAAPVFGFLDHPYLQGLWYLTAFTTVTTGVSYAFAKDTFKIFTKK